MKREIFKVAIISLTVFLISSCGVGLKVPIERGKIVGDFTIKFSEKGTTLKPGEFFTLAQLGIKANGGNPKIAPDNFALTVRAFKKNKVKSYSITISRPGDSKVYYGKIAFFNSTKQNETDAVARYYEIDIAKSYFENATRGRTAMIYEYFNLSYAMRQFKIPTWVILMSDEPF